MQPPYGPPPGDAARRKLWIFLGVAVGVIVLVAVVVAVTVVKHGSASGGTSAGGGSSSSGTVTGTEDNWFEAVCKTGTFMDHGGNLPGARGRGFCIPRAGRTPSISIGQFDSDYKMRNAVAAASMTYYVAGVEPDGTVICFAIYGKDASPLEPLTQFGFTVNTVGK